MSRQNKERKLINLEFKKEIICKWESGESVGYLIAEYGMAISTISTILKNKEEIKSVQVVKGISRLSSCMVTLLHAVGLEWITTKYTYFIICYNEKML